MALLDVAIRNSGLATGEKAWPWLRDLQLGIQLPEQIVVTNLFAKVLKLRRRPAALGSAYAGPFQKTIGYREYAYHPMPINLAVGVPKKHQAQLGEWLIQINYLGKRGGFVQLLEVPSLIENQDNYISLTSEVTQFSLNGLIQQLDDCSPKMKFAEADIYNKKRPKRLTRPIIIPYRIARSSRSYTLYERIEA